MTTAIDVPAAQPATTEAQAPANTPAVTAATAPQGAATQALTQSWVDNISEDLRHNPTLQKFKTVDDLAKSYMNVEKLVGTKGIPGDDAPPEVKAEFFKRLGRPDDPNGYEFAKADGMEWDGEVASKFKQRFHELGLTKKQVEEITKDYAQYAATMGKSEMDRIAKSTEQQQIKYKQEFDRLKETWGPKFDENVVAAQRAQRAFGLDGETLDKIESVIGPRKLIEMFYNVGKNISDDKIIDGMNSNTFTMTPQQANVRLNEMMTDPKIKEALMNKGHPLYGQYNEERLRLIRVSSKLS